MLLRSFIMVLAVLSQISAMQLWEKPTQGLVRRFAMKLPQPYTWGTARWCSQIHRSTYADATIDTAFKEMMWRQDNDPVASSFISTFVPNIQVESLELLDSEPIAIPALKQRGKKQTFMDFHVKSKDGHHYIIEMQSHRHIKFDERALFYACSVYSRQLDEKCFDDSSWFRYLKPAIAIQVVDYDTNRARGLTFKRIDQDGKEVRELDPDDEEFLKRIKENPLEAGQTEKHYMMTDKNSGQVIDHLQMIQIELPRYKISHLPEKGEQSTDKDWWIRVLRYSDSYSEDDLKSVPKIPPFVNQALSRLKFSTWDPRVMEEYYDHKRMRSDYSTALQVERAEGKEEGRANAMNSIKKAISLIKQGHKDNTFIAEKSGLTPDEVRDLH